jgi:hypothetical protein
MKRLLAVAFTLALFQTASIAQADNFSFSINVGGPPVVIEQPPDFLYPPELGFGVAVGVPYDMYYIDGIYYIYRGGGWFRTSNYGDNWIKMRHRELPPALRRYKIYKIHEFRDREYRSYSQDRTHYRGRAFRPSRPARGPEHGDMRGPGHEGRPEMRDQHPNVREDHQGVPRPDLREGHPGEQRPNERGGERREHER